MNEWISIEDEFPIGFALVRVCDDEIKYFEVAYWYGDADCWIGNVSQRIDGVTHWMPLPEPPK